MTPQKNMISKCKPDRFAIWHQGVFHKRNRALFQQFSSQIQLSLEWQMPFSRYCTMNFGMRFRNLKDHMQHFIAMSVRKQYKCTFRIFDKKPAIL